MRYAASRRALCALTALGDRDRRSPHYRTASPAISPDGRLVAVVVNRILWNEDREVSDLDIVDVRSRTVHAVARAGEGLSDPAFSPDGARLAYLARDAATNRIEIFIMPANGGPARAVTNLRSDSPVSRGAATDGRLRSPQRIHRLAATAPTASAIASFLRPSQSPRARDRSHKSLRAACWRYSREPTDEWR